MTFKKKKANLMKLLTEHKEIKEKTEIELLFRKVTNILMDGEQLKTFFKKIGDQERYGKMREICKFFREFRKEFEYDK